jgi:apolipoprotein N-acyltransferase
MVSTSFDKTFFFGMMLFSFFEALVSPFGIVTYCTGFYWLALSITDGGMKVPTLLTMM